MEREKLIRLVTAVQRGNEAAAGDLYDAFYDGIYYFILKSVDNDPELAADLTQDTFLEILETIGKLQEPAAFVTWSRQIAYHKCTAYFRKRRELLLDEQEDGYSAFDTVEEERSEFIPDEALDQEDFKQTIREMIDELPNEQRSALLLRYFNEISVKEIAAIQGVTEGTVKSRLNYARKAIQQAVESYEKRSGIRLHIAGVTPMLLWFFRACRRGSGMAVASGSANAVYGAAGTGATGAAAASAGAAAAATGAKAGLAAMGKAAAAKIVAAVAAAAVGVAGVAAVVTNLMKQPEQTPEIWSGQMGTFEHLDDLTEYQDPDYGDFYYPEEDDCLSFRLEILDRQETMYTGNLEITWPDGEVFRSECTVTLNSEDEETIDYTIGMDPLILRNYPITYYEGFYLNYMSLDYIKETGTVTISFPWMMYVGQIYRDVELTRETSGETVFLTAPIEEEALAPYQLRNINESSVYCERADGSYGWMTWQEMEELRYTEHMDQEIPEARIIYIRFPGDDQVFLRYENFSAGEEAPEFLREVDGYPVNGLEFYYSPESKHMEIPEGFLYILPGSIMGTRNLETVTLPGSIRFLGDSSFDGCPSLQELVIPEGTETVGAFLVSSCTSLKRLSLPSTMEELGAYPVWRCPSLEILEVAEGNPRYHSSGNCIIETETGTLLAGCRESDIPADGTVTAIGRYAFVYSTALEKITVPEGVTQIGYGAFMRCDNLREITLPGSLEVLDDQAFRFCANIRDIYYAGTMAEFGKIQGIRWDAPYHNFDFTVHCSDGNLAVG